MATEDQMVGGFIEEECAELQGITSRAFDKAVKTMRNLITLTEMIQPPTRIILDYELANIAWADASGNEFIQAEIAYEDGSIGYVDVHVTKEEDSPSAYMQQTKRVNLVVTCIGLDDFLQIFRAAYDAEIDTLERIADEHEQQRLRRVNRSHEHRA